MIKKLALILVVLFSIPLCSMSQADSVTMSHSRQRVKSHETDCDKLQKKVGVLKDSISRLKVELEAMQNKAADTMRFVNKIAIYQENFEQCQNQIVQLKTDNSRLTKSNEDYQKNIQQKEKEIGHLQEEIKKKNDSLKLFGKLDEIIYKQCLLYPLERRYDSVLLAESKHCLDKMKSIKKTHPDNYNTYYHFLTEYVRYNTELLKFLEEQRIYFEKKGWQTGAVIEQYVDSKLRQLTYYPYYAKRNSKPWESILYLDEVLEDYEKTVKEGRINAETMQKFIDRLQPSIKR